MEEKLSWKPVDEMDSLFNESTRAALDHEHPINGDTPARIDLHKFTLQIHAWPTEVRFCLGGKSG